MKEFTLYVLSLLLGISVVILSVSYYETNALETKTDCIIQLSKNREFLETRKSIQETGIWIDSLQVRIDSLNNIK